MDESHVEVEVGKLLVEIERLGEKAPDGKTQVKFVKLIDDDRCSNIFEAIMSTLRAAKKRSKVQFEGELLLKGMHDDTIITVL